jgi:hypothetical protein
MMQPSRARRLGVTAVLVAAAALGTAGSASAAPGALATPSGCNVYADDGGVIVDCARGTGEFRAYTRCDKNNWPDYDRYGKWKRPGALSGAECDRGDRAFNQGFQVR